MLDNMLCHSAPSSPSVLCFKWLELGLRQLHFFITSCLLVRSSKRRGRGGERPSFSLQVSSILPPVATLGFSFQLLLALTEQGSDISFRSVSLRQEVQVSAPQQPSFGLLHPDTLNFFISPALGMVAAS